MNQNYNLEMLEVVAKGLKDLCDDVVFVGGIVTSLYIQDIVQTDIRPTDDVDCVVELASRQDYHKLEHQIRELGFQHPIGQKTGLICRWDFQGITVDIMSTDATITGFTNKWYKEGIQNKIKSRLPSGKEVYIFSLPYFLASKFEAFKGRGENDYRSSHDIEDIVTVLDGCGDIDLFQHASVNVQKYLKKEFSKFAKSNQFEESLYGHMSRIGNLEERVGRLVEKIQNYIS